MFEAYSVAVKVTLINGVTSGLMNISRAFAKTHGDAEKLQRQLDQIKFKMVGGAFLTGAGLFGLSLINKTIPAAREYAHQLNILNMAGLKHQEVAEAISAAWRNSGDVITTTASENLRSILDLRNVLGSMGDAKWALPIVSKIGAVMASSSEHSVRDNAQDIAFSMAKALDIIGAAKDPRTFEREAGMMSKVVTAFQNRVSPRQYQSVFQYARQAKFDLSDEFKYEFLPSLMLEASSGSGAGGGSRGVGPMLAAIYRVTNQGYVSKKAIPVLEKLGLLASHDFARTTTAGTVGAQLRGKDLAAQNPFLWNQQVLVPAIQRMLGPSATPQQIRGVINQVFAGNQLAASAMTEFYSKPQNYLRDQQIIRGAMPYDQAYRQALKNDPMFAQAAAGAQWTNFKTVVGNNVLPMLTAGIMKFTGALTVLSNWMREHTGMAKGLVLGFGALSAAMAFGGTVILLSAAFDGLALAAGVLASAAVLPAIIAGVAGFAGAALAVGAPILLCVGALTAFGAALYQLFKHWDLSKGVIQNIKAEFSLFWSWIADKANWLLGLVGLQFGPGEAGKNGPHGRPVTHQNAPAGDHFNAQSVRRDPWHHASRYVAPARKAPASFTGDVHLDGAKVGKVLWRHQNDARDRAVLSASGGYDPGLALAPAGLGYS